MQFTAKEIAERIAGDGELQPAVERVHHWTREGLLEPIGDRNPGTGRRRLYSEDAVVAAMVLTLLAGFGVGVNVMRTALTLSRHAWGNLRASRDRGIVTYLCLDAGGSVGPPLVRLFEQPDVTITTADGNEVASLGRRPEMLAHADAMLSINLTKLLIP
jgi:DNA-binding transcriptional MerR regulator